MVQLPSAASDKGNRRSAPKAALCTSARMQDQVSFRRVLYLVPFFPHASISPRLRLLLPEKPLPLPLLTNDGTGYDDQNHIISHFCYTPLTAAEPHFSLDLFLSSSILSDWETIVFRLNVRTVSEHGTMKHFRNQAECRSINPTKTPSSLSSWLPAKNQLS